MSKPLSIPLWIVTAILFAGCFDAVVGAPCRDGLAGCETGCVDLEIDPNNCGGCGTKCDNNQQCILGSCQTSCPDDTTVCDNACADLNSDPAHCGDCKNNCGDEETCVDGVCRGCTADQTVCENKCVNLNTAADNCGACGVSCPAESPFCVLGECQSTCPEATIQCADNCVDPASNHDHCGACGNTCDSQEVCLAGHCKSDGCVWPTTNCDGQCVDISNNTSHCGTCGQSCQNGQVCLQGTCVTSCSPGAIICDGNCTNIQNNLNHCGRCGLACGPLEVCAAGHCIPDCSPLAYCDQLCVDLNADNKHCGGCFNNCAPEEFCVMGTCQLTCPETYLACNDECVDPATNPFNCGGCGNSCETGICQNGVCGIERTGHLVVVGHNYTATHTILNRLLANTLFITTNNPARVLGYVEYADNKPGGQVDRVNNAINSESVPAGLAWTFTPTSSATTVRDTLLNYDVLLIYEQTGATDTELQLTGNLWTGALRDFLGLGGIIVITDGVTGNRGTWQIPAAANLFSASGTLSCTNCTLDVVQPTDAVAQGLSTSYLGLESTIQYTTSDGVVVVESTAAHLPVVIHRVFSPEQLGNK